MELTTLKPLDEVEVHLKHPVTGKELDGSFVVYSTDSKVYRQTLRDIISKSERDIENDDFTLIASCVKDFKNMKENGKVVEFSLENTIKILKEYSWISDQISIATNTKSNFFLNDSKK